MNGLITWEIVAGVGGWHGSLVQPLGDARSRAQGLLDWWHHRSGTSSPLRPGPHRYLTSDQGGVERGFRFLKDLLFLASSVFVKKPERIMALSFIMVLCLLVYCLTEFRLRSRLAETQHSIADQVQKPIARPTMRWVFQCFEGIELLHVHTAVSSLVLVLRLQPAHRLILQLLGPLYEKIYNLSG